MKKLLFAVFAASVFMYSCDPEGPVDPPVEPIELDYTLKTNQDQMGDFSSNEMVHFGGQFWSVGGENSYHPAGDPSSDVWRSTNGVNWISVTSGQFFEMRDHQLTVFDGQMWVNGGENATGGILTSIYSSPAGSTWTIRSAGVSPFGFVSGHSVTEKDGKLWLIKAATFGNEVWSSPDGVTWSLENGSAFTYTRYFRTVVLDGFLYVIGGQDVSANVVNKVWRSPDGITWTDVTPSGALFAPRKGHTATVHDNKIFVIGGQTDTTAYTDDIWYSEDGLSWTEYTPGSLFTARRNHSAISNGGELWLFGGESSRGNLGEIGCLKIK